MPATTYRNQRNNPYALDGLFVAFHRSAAGTAWRWRTELAVHPLLGAALWRLTLLVTSPGQASCSAPWSLVLLAVPVTRRFITRRFWCVLSRHRLQRVCYETRLHTRAGRLPLILWIRPTQVGERAWVLCRAGICAEDFEAHTGELRAACYAREARVTRNTALVPAGDHRHHPPRHPRGHRHRALAAPGASAPDRDHEAATCRPRQPATWPHSMAAATT